MPGLLALSIATRWEVTKEVDVERLARQSPEVLNCLRSDLWLHRRATDRAQAASLADRSCEFYRPKSRHWCQDQWVLYLEKVNQAPIRPHHAPPHQRPAEAPPSTCRISPVTNAVLSRYRAALTISCVSPIRPMGCKPERNSRISGECTGVMIHARRNCVYPNTPTGVFDRKRTGHCVKATFGQSGKSRRKRCHWLFGDRCRDVDDVTGARPQHRGQCLLRDVEESRQIYSCHPHKVGFGIVDERLGDEDAGVVYQRVDAPKALDGRADDAVGSRGGGDVAIDDKDFRITGKLARPNRAGGGNNAIANLAEAFYQTGTDAL